MVDRYIQLQDSGFMQVLFISPYSFEGRTPKRDIVKSNCAVIIADSDPGLDTALVGLPKSQTRRCGSSKGDRIVD